MTNQEKEALLKRIYALPTGWADGGGFYVEGGPVGSEDAAMLWPEDVVDAINRFNYCPMCGRKLEEAE